MASFGQITGLFVFPLGFNSLFFWPRRSASQTLSFVLLTAASTYLEVCDLGDPWHSFLFVVFPVGFDHDFTHFSVQGTRPPRVYFRVGFSPCVSHLDDIRDVSKSPVPPFCSNGPSVNPYFRPQWPVLGRLAVLLASSFGVLLSLSSSSSGVLLRRVCSLCF